jgi:hypothetical protein
VKNVYDTFVDDPKLLPDGGQVDIAIRDLNPGKEKYATRYVRARIASSPEALPEGDVLWLRYQRGRLHPKPWAIQILEELGEFKPAEAVQKT